MKTVRDAISLLTRREKFYLALLMGVSAVQAILEMATVGSIAPFLVVAARPEKIQDIAPIAWLYQTLGFSSSNSFLLFLAGVSFAILIVTNVFSGFALWAQLRFQNGRIFSFSTRLLAHYLNQPYTFFLNRHSADMGRSILSEAQQTVTNVLAPMVKLVSQVLSSIAILALLLAMDTQVALIAGLVLGLSYTSIYWLFRRRLHRLGRDHMAANRGLYKSVSEAFGGVKEVKVLGTEQVMVGLFRESAARASRLAVSTGLTKNLPKLVMDVISIGMVLTVAVLLLIRGGGMAEAVPTLGMLAFAGFRLMPKLQGIYHAAAQIRYAGSVIEHIRQEFLQADQAIAVGMRRKRSSAKSRIELNHEMALNNVSYAYPDAQRPALSNITLTIRANTTVGLIGTTGSGKTTLGDIILGLLRPQKGEIQIDGRVLSGELWQDWMENVGYVPQHVFLGDDTVARNIAFGVPPADVDLERVKWAASIAKIHDFVSNEMPQGYDTTVGERGVRLSGGQRQRIGIARALYRDPRVLLLDEATSALDSETEASVMTAIESVAGSRTIVIIAHRITTLASCSCIYELQDGRIFRSGAYRDLFGAPGQIAPDSRPASF